MTFFFNRKDRIIQFIPMNNIVSVPSSSIPINWKYLGANFFCSSLFQRVQVSDCKRYLLTFLLDLNGDRWIRRGFNFLGHCCFLCFFLGGFRKKSHDVGDSRVSNIQLNQLWPSPSFNHRTVLHFVRWGWLWRAGQIHLATCRKSLKCRTCWTSFKFLLAVCTSFPFVYLHRLWSVEDLRKTKQLKLKYQSLFRFDKK